MRRTFLIDFLFLLISWTVSAQVPELPVVKNNFSRLTSYKELSSWVMQKERQDGLLKVEVIGHSVQGRDLYALKFSSSEFGKDPSKIRVLIFAQQHGNEQSGKEGALLLARDLLRPENRYLFDRIDLVLVPQVNPDGSELNQRRNAKGMDLNRNHLILTEPETVALHRLFDKYLFDVSMDVHEYSPYGDDWKKYGYRKNSDVTIGTLTQLNIPESIRQLSRAGYLPFIFKYLRARGFSSFEYSPGGPPEVEYIRHSTFDINDGRQGFGILNTFSFIQEGMNGKDDSIENLRHRAEGQEAGMRGLLEYAYQNKDKIKKLVSGERKKLISGNEGREISIQSVHVADGETLEMPLASYQTGKDTVVTVKDYRPVVKSLCDVTKPDGYLVPKDCPELTEWASRQGFKQVKPALQPGDHIFQYMIDAIDSIDFEGDKIGDPEVTLKEIKELPAGKEYIYIPVSQLKGTLLVLALEPKSMLGLVTYEKYSGLLKPGQPFPVLRVEKLKK